MNRRSYLDSVAAVSLVDQSKSETWLSIFLSSEVFVCGFNPGHEEHLFWYALTERLNLDPSKRKPVVVYLFCASEQDMVSCTVLQTLLRSYEVEVEIIRLADNNGKADFCSGWKTLLGHMLLRCAGVSESSSSVRVDATPFPDHPRKGGSNYVVSGKTTVKNVSRCWMNIRADKLSATSNGLFLFDCLIHGRRFVYQCKKADLFYSFQKNEVEIISNAPERYSFYLDYRSGEIYSTVSPNDKHVVIQLIPVMDAVEYQSIIHAEMNP